MEYGDADEIEIRGLSILAVHKIEQKLKSQQTLPNIIINSVIIDFYLWDYRRTYSEQLESMPFHKVRSIFY
ncbi:hypothetical protein B4U80_00161 [Leptotrombidium deliense]|uniref:Queuosine 5'-phosphate N-glycosylase/hydrolase n=1 Tax=Leptotrombidium deliense TaxID=299467 RepID=A0A443SEP3_9ACAR|nr:hypothetical protein B4U80_00161 [Leptotrombidium deliense]